MASRYVSPTIKGMSGKTAAISLRRTRAFTCAAWLAVLALFLLSRRQALVPGPEETTPEQDEEARQSLQARVAEQRVDDMVVKPESAQNKMFGLSDRELNVLKAQERELGVMPAIMKRDPIVIDGFNTGTCHIEDHTEYFGEDALVWGANNLQESSAECCRSCSAMQGQGANVWVWCGAPGGCGHGRSYKECWCKRCLSLNPLQPAGMRGPHVPWVSGAFFSEEDVQREQARRQQEEEQNKQYLRDLKENAELPLVYLDVTIQDEPVGRIEIVLFGKDSPLAAENFRQLCTGENGVVPEGHEGAGKAYHFKGAEFYRIVDQFINQAGTGTESVFGGMFKDDEGGLNLKHDRKGLLSMANAGPDTNTSHFSIMMAPAPHLDGKYVVFGQVVEGFEVMDRINALARQGPGNTAGPNSNVRITDSGELRHVQIRV